MALLNYTSKITAWTTLSEIQQTLAKHGASHFSIRNEGSRPAAISFTVDYNGRPLNFLLPIRHEGIMQILKNDPKAKSNMSKSGIKLDDDHAVNVGWRIVKDWIEAQMALVEVDMVKIEEIFLPFLIINEQGQTLAQKMLSGDGMKKLLG